MAIISQPPIKLVEVDQELVALAAERKARGGLPFADCFVWVAAKRWEAGIVTGDREFKILEKEVEILWLGSWLDTF